VQAHGGRHPGFSVASPHGRLGDQLGRSLVLTAPLLYLTFVYFECVRYALIVWWYRRLAAGVARPASRGR